MGDRSSDKKHRGPPVSDRPDPTRDNRSNLSTPFTPNPVPSTISVSTVTVGVLPRTIPTSEGFGPV